MREGRRPVRPGAYLTFLAIFAFIVVLLHAPYFSLPYFWDEMGQFVPAALDILHDGAWVAHSTIPNVHPPGVLAYLALVWRIFGYSIAATRFAMLWAASLLVFFSFLLAIDLCAGMRGAPAFAAVLLLIADPLFYTQAMMAQLDMPAALFTVLALLLFLKNRHISAALACTALVLCKETGLIVPLVFIAILAADRKRQASAAFYVAPLLVLSIWLLILKRATGYWTGDPGFAHYNIEYALHPVRIALCLLRRFAYLFILDFRWVGTIGLFLAWRKRALFSSYRWRVTWLIFGLHVLLVSVLGGAELERYLLPVLPLLYIAMAAAWTVLLPKWRIASTATVAAGLVLGFFLNPPFPFPYENNLAMADFVMLQRSAAGLVEEVFPTAAIYTAWPLTQALRNPEFGYVNRPVASVETSDLRASTLRRIDANKPDVLIMYSRTWEPTWGVLQVEWVRHFLAHFYEYEPQMSTEDIQAHFGLLPVARFTQRGQWIELYARPGLKPSRTEAPGQRVQRHSTGAKSLQS